MARLSRAPGVMGALKQLNDELHILHARAGMPSVREMAKECHSGPNLVKAVFSAPRTPHLPLLLKIVDLLAKYVRKADADALCDRFDVLWQSAMAEEVPDLFATPSTDSDDEDDFGPPSTGARSAPPDPVKPAGGGGVNTPPADSAHDDSATDDSGVAAASPDVPSHASRALFIGVDRYRTADGPPDTHRDLAPVRDLARIFHRPGANSAQAARSELLLNPTREHLWESFVAAASQAQETLFIYYTGHGIRDAVTSDVYLAVADTTTENGLTDNAISVRDLRYLLSLSPAKRLVIVVDALFDTRPERQTTVLHTRLLPDEPYNVRSDLTPRSVFVLTNSATKGSHLSAFSSGLAHIFASTGSGKTVAFVHAQLALRAEAEQWTGLRAAQVNGGDRIQLGSLLFDRPTSLAIWDVDEVLRPTVTHVSLPTASITALAASALPWSRSSTAGSPWHGVSVAAVNDSGIVRLWNVADQDVHEITDISVGTGNHHVKAVAMPAAVDGRPTLVTGTSEGSIRYWDWDRGRWGDLHVATGLVPVTAVAAMSQPDGRSIVGAVIGDQEILAWALDGSESQYLGRLQLDVRVSSIALATRPDGRTSVVLGQPAGRIVVHDVETGELLAALHLGHGEVTAVAGCSAADGRTIVAAVIDGRLLKFWDLSNDTAIGEPVLFTSSHAMLAAVAGTKGSRFVVAPAWRDRNKIPGD